MMLKPLLLLAILSVALWVGFHPRWGRIVYRSKWPWWRIAYFAIVAGGVAMYGVLWCMGF